MQEPTERAHATFLQQKFVYDVLVMARCANRLWFAPPPLRAAGVRHCFFLLLLATSTTRFTLCDVWAFGLQSCRAVDCDWGSTDDEYVPAWEGRDLLRPSRVVDPMLASNTFGGETLKPNISFAESFLGNGLVACYCKILKFLRELPESDLPSVVGGCYA